MQGNAHVIQGSVHVIQGRAHVIQGSVHVIQGSAHVIQGSAHVIQGSVTFTYTWHHGRGCGQLASWQGVWSVGTMAGGVVSWHPRQGCGLTFMHSGGDKARDLILVCDGHVWWEQVSTSSEYWVGAEGAGQDAARDGHYPTGVWGGVRVKRK